MHGGESSRSTADLRNSMQVLAHNGLFYELGRLGKAVGVGVNRPAVHNERFARCVLRRVDGIETAQHMPPRFYSISKRHVSNFSYFAFCRLSAVLSQPLFSMITLGVCKCNEEGGKMKEERGIGGK